MILRREFAVWTLAGIVAFGAVPEALHGATAARTFPAAVKRNLDEEARLVVNLLQNYHYSGRAFRDIENKEMIGRFLADLDPSLLVLSREDIDFIHRRFERTLKTVYVYKGDMQPALEIHALFVDRARQRFDWIDRRLGGSFDLAGGTVSADELMPAADTEGENRRWELRLTDELIRAILEGRDEAEAREFLARHYRKVRSYLSGMDPYEVRAMFLDAIIRSFDPRSGYFSADSTREFALQMEGAVTGIGLDVRKEDGRCIVDRVHAGGPADLHSDLQPGDELLALASGEEEWKPVPGMRLREVTSVMRGTPDTNLRVRYRRDAEGGDQEISLARSRVTLIGQRAFGAVHTLPGENGCAARRIGVVEFPSFYGSQEEEGSSVSADVAELLDAMTASGIDGLVVDLRNNPGGNMDEAVKLCGLFLHGGTAAHSRAQTGEPRSYKIEPAAHVYDGPLIVLTNPESASASELLSGAMRFHRRAVVMGGESTFGKGTVQNYIQLDRLQSLAPQRDWGTLRLTFATFHLPNGGPIQRDGIPSDIVLPLKAADGVKRESELEHALPATSLAAAKSEQPPGGPRIPAEGEILKTLAERVKANIETLPEWKLWLDEERHYSPDPKEAEVDLNIETRRTEWNEWQAGAEGLVNTRLDLLATAGHAIEPVDIAATRDARDAHDERLRGLLADRTPDPIARLDDGGIVVETTHRHLRRLRWNMFPFQRYTGISHELVAAFNTGAGTGLGRDEFGVILSELQLIENPSEAAARAVFTQHVPEGTPPEAIQSGIDALLARIVALDPNLRAERKVFDVPLREALRTAAAWAAGESGASAGGTQAP